MCNGICPEDNKIRFNINADSSCTHTIDSIRLHNLKNDVTLYGEREKTALSVNQTGFCRDRFL